MAVLETVLVAMMKVVVVVDVVDDRHLYHLLEEGHRHHLLSLGLPTLSNHS